MPTQVTTSPKATLRAMLSTGRAVNACAVAAGSTSRAKMSRAPVIWLASAAATPSNTRKAIESARTPTPRASATSASTDANSRGRPITPRMARAATLTARRTATRSAVTPRKVPKSRLLIPLRLPR